MALTQQTPNGRAVTVFHAWICTEEMGMRMMHMSKAQRPVIGLARSAVVIKMMVQKKVLVQGTLKKIVTSNSGCFEKKKDKYELCS